MVVVLSSQVLGWFILQEIVEWLCKLALSTFQREKEIRLLGEDFYPTPTGIGILGGRHFWGESGLGLIYKLRTFALGVCLSCFATIPISHFADMCCLAAHPPMVSWLCLGLPPSPPLDFSVSQLCMTWEPWEDDCLVKQIQNAVRGLLADELSALPSAPCLLNSGLGEGQEGGRGLWKLSFLSWLLTPAYLVWRLELSCWKSWR